MRIHPAPTPLQAAPISAARGSAPIPLPRPRTDLMVLSAAAYRALVSAPRSAVDLAGTFDVNVAQASGQISIAPGTMEGVVKVSIDLFHVPTWPEPPGPIRQLHLTAQLRGSWVTRMTEPEEPAGTQVQQLAEAITKLAQIPGQRTVEVAAHY